MTAVAVCGFPRCGSTMLMRMLAAGGVPPAGDAGPPSYELAGLHEITTLTSEQLDGRAVKALDQVLHDGMPRYSGVWRFVWVDRAPREQARSQVKMMTTIGMPVHPSAEDTIARSLEADRPRARKALKRLGSVLTVSFEDAVNSPHDVADQLAGFVHPLTFDAEDAAWVVHFRRPECLPDMTFELGEQA